MLKHKPLNITIVRDNIQTLREPAFSRSPNTQVAASQSHRQLRCLRFQSQMNAVSSNYL